MIVTPYDYDIDFLASDLVRSPGLHASEVFGDLFESLDPDRYKYEGPPNPLSLAMGTAWENHFEYLLQKRGVNAVRPGEFFSPPYGRKKTRIAYSPDLIIFNGILRCGEIKWTSKSANGLPVETSTFLAPKYDKYVSQIMLYTYWLRLEFDCLVQGWISMALMHQPWNPQHRAFNLDFEERELQENHDACMNHAAHKGMI